MSKFYKLVDPKPPTGAVRKDSYASGASWTLYQTSDAFVLEYVSGELAGREKTLTIAEEDAVRLASGAATIDDILIQYNAS